MVAESWTKSEAGRGMLTWAILGALPGRAVAAAMRGHCESEAAVQGSASSSVEHATKQQGGAVIGRGFMLMVSAIGGVKKHILERESTHTIPEFIVHGGCWGLAKVD